MTDAAAPAVIGSAAWGALLATAATVVLLAVLIKGLIDADSKRRSSAPRPPPPPATPRHAQPAAPDETAPITTVQPARARHRKDPRWN
ncbi:hypothetical protein [Streptomyces sp. NPDC050264]|uniref:hypothetical protein n=1 Tax=Streptomyces sp. NPDC050264 TaxID=3155038 RepID=UPI00341B028C